MNETYPVGDSPLVRIDRAAGDLRVEGWDRAEVRVSSDDVRVSRDGDGTLVLEASDDLRIQVPHSTTLTANRIDGDLVVRGVAALEVGDVGGDVTCDVNGERGVRLERVGGDTTIREVAGPLMLGDVGGDVELMGINGATRVERIGGDAEIVNIGGELSLGDVGGDLEARDTRGTVRVARIGGDAEIAGSAGGLECGDIGGDLDAEEIHGEMRVGRVGGSTDLAEVYGRVEIGDIGGDFDAEEIHGELRIGRVGGDASVDACAGSLELGYVGGDADVRLTADRTIAVRAGGDIDLELHESTSLALQVQSGGEMTIAGRTVARNGGAGVLRYPPAMTEGHVMAGGDLNIQGGPAPEIVVAGGAEGDWNSGRDWEAFGQEMNERMNRDWGARGERIGSQVERWAEKFSEDMERWAEKFSRDMERKGEDIERRMSSKTWRSGRGASDVTVKLNGKSWTMDRERIERLRNAANEAAAIGLSSAAEAINRALAGMGMPTPPAPPVPPVPPAPPVHPTHPMHPDAPAASAEPAPTSSPAPVPAPASSPAPVVATGETIRMTVPPADDATRDLDRAAILRLVAEGKISVDEADMLLEALGVAA